VATPEHAPTAAESDRGAIAAQISREIVQLHANMFGRGPTKAKTFVNDAYILCVLEDIFTPAERTLIGAGSADQVEATRHAFQLAVEDDFVAIAENASGRKVRAFISAVNIDPEVSTELFLLVPDAAAELASSDGAGPSADGQPPT
jgi:uncharacterized protein YbcI